MFKKICSIRLGCSLPFLRYRFTPTLLSILITLIVFSVLMHLGFWQLNRAAEKKALQTRYQTRSGNAPLDLNTTKTLPPDLQYYPVKVSGFVLNDQQFLLDNRIQQHQPGYEVLTLLRLNDEKKVVLVNRGWIPQGNSRANVPMVSPITNKISWTGIVSVPSDKYFTLGPQTEDTSWPKRIQRVDIAQMSRSTGYQLLPFVVLLNADQPYGFQRQWSPMDLKISTNYGYAFQWFALACTLMVIFIVLNTVRVNDHDA